MSAQLEATRLLMLADRINALAQSKRMMGYHEVNRLAVPVTVTEQVAKLEDEVVEMFCATFGVELSVINIAGISV